MNFHKDNPHIANGTAKDGELHQAIAWERAREMERRKSLPEDEQKRLEESDRNFQRRMQSSVS